MSAISHSVAAALGQIAIPASAQPRGHIKPPKPTPPARYPAPESEIKKFGAKIEALRLEGYTHATIETGSA